jgi:formate-dependent phosphoribosylglycinamide formyltransferase (GAR transformylase)
MNKNVLILGGNILNKGIIEYCILHGYSVIIVDWSKSIQLKCDIHIPVDVKDFNLIISELERLKITSLYGIYTSIDLAVLSLNKIREKYGLTVCPEIGINNVSSKSKITSIWDDNNLLNRHSSQYLDFCNELYDLSQKYSLIIKPNISSSSRGITILPLACSTADLEMAFKKAKEESFDKVAIVEEFVNGQEFTCEMLGDGDGNVSVFAISVKYHTKNTINNRIAVKLHYNSAEYEPSVYEQIAAFGKRCFSSLGLRNTFGHLELIMKSNGNFTPIEIGARSSGFIANPLVSMASEHDYLGSYFNIQNGIPIENKDYINTSMSSMYYFYDIQKGLRMNKICNLMDFVPSGIQSRYNNREKLFIGTTFDNISNDNERIGYEILYGSKSILTIENIMKAEHEFISFLKK